MFSNISIQDMLSQTTIFLLLQLPMSVNKELNYIKQLVQNKYILWLLY